MSGCSNWLKKIYLKTKWVFLSPKFEGLIFLTVNFEWMIIIQNLDLKSNFCTCVVDSTAIVYILSVCIRVTQILNAETFVKSIKLFFIALYQQVECQRYFLIFSLFIYLFFKKVRMSNAGLLTIDSGSHMSGNWKTWHENRFKWLFAKLTVQ